MNNRLPSGLIAIAFLQIIPLLVLPPSTLAGLNAVAWGVVAALFALLAFNMLRRRAWSRLAVIFVQGFNIIVRLLILLGGATEVADSGLVVNYWMIGTCIVSMIASAVVLYYVDQPEVQMAMQ
ncbi:MAG: hypothetical protein GX552_15540 [Chloroflexi bacterium]|nr:hypothetical protein [Chloroflexota bacterium]